MDQTQNHEPVPGSFTISPEEMASLLQKHAGRIAEIKGFHEEYRKAAIRDGNANAVEGMPAAGDTTHDFMIAKTAARFEREATDAQKAFPLGFFMFFIDAVYTHGHLHKIIIGKERVIGRMEAEIAEKQAEIVKEKAELVKEKAEIVEKEAELVKKMAQLVQEKGEIVKREGVLVEKQAELTEEKAQLAEEKTEVAELIRERRALYK